MVTTGTARMLRKRSTRAERIIWKVLRNRRFASFKFRRQHRSFGHIVDFYSREARLVIELDGEAHGHPGSRFRDHERDRFLAEKGVQVLRFWNRQVYLQLPWV